MSSNEKLITRWFFRERGGRGMWAKAQDLSLSMLAVILVGAVIFSGGIGVLFALDGPGIQLDGAWLPRVVMTPLLVCAFLASWAIGARNRSAWAAPIVSWAAMTRLQRAQSVVTAFLAFALCLGSGGALGAISVLNYAPVRGNIHYIVVDKVDDLGEAHKRRFWLLRVLAETFDTARTAGLDVRFGQAGIEDVLDRAVARGVQKMAIDDPMLTTDPVVVALADELYESVEAVSDIPQTLELVSAALADRLGDAITLASGYRRPPAGIGWPVQPGLTTCRWLAPPVPSAGASAKEAKILTLSVLHDVAVASVFSLTLESPSSIGWPALTLDLLDDAGVVVQSIPVPPPARDAKWAPPANGVSFGCDGDRLAYRVELPRVGTRLHVRFQGADWSAAAALVPELRESGIPLRPRRVDVSASPTPLMDWLNDVLPASNDRRAIATPKQPHFGKSGGAALTVTDGTAPPPSGPVLQVVRYTPSAVTATGLDHSHRWVDQPLRRLRLDQTASAGWPLYDPKLAPTGVEVLIDAVDSAGIRQPVMFFPSSRRDVVTVFIPQQPSGRHIATVGQLLTLAASLAQRGGDPAPLMFAQRASGAEFEPPSQVDATPVAGALPYQVWQALGEGRLEQRAPVARTNSYARQASRPVAFLSVGVLVIVFCAQTLTTRGR